MRRAALALAAGLLVALAPAVPAVAVDAPPSYSFSEVPALGGTASFALAVNASGDVVGTARTGAGSRPQHAFATHGDHAHDLGTLPGSTFSRALDVNDRGVAVGEAFTAAPEVSRAVLWSRDEVLRDLGTLDGAAGAVANAVNARSDVVGVSGGTAVMWPRGRTAVALPWLADTPRSSARAWDVASDGTAVGQSTAVVPHGDHVHYRGHAVRWDVAGVSDLGVLEEDGTSTAYAISAPGPRGVVVGEASRDGGTAAAVFGRHGPSALPTPGDRRHARANDASRDGSVVVGHATGFYGFPTLDGAAVLWHDGQPHELGDLVADLPAGWVLRSAEEVSDSGMVVGYATVGSQARGFRLDPQP